MLKHVAVICFTVDDLIIVRPSAAGAVALTLTVALTFFAAFAAAGTFARTAAAVAAAAVAAVARAAAAVAVIVRGNILVGIFFAFINTRSSTRTSCSIP